LVVAKLLFQPQVEDTIVVIEYPVEIGTLPPVLSSSFISSIGDSSGISIDMASSAEGGGGGLREDEHERRLIGVRNRRYGRTVIAIYVCAPSGKWDLDVRSEEFVDVSK